MRCGSNAVRCPLVIMCGGASVIGVIRSCGRCGCKRIWQCHAPKGIIFLPVGQKK